MCVPHAFLQFCHSLVAYEVAQYLVGIGQGSSRTFTCYHVAVLLIQMASILGVGSKVLFKTRIAGSLLAVEDARACQYHRGSTDGTYALAGLVMSDERLSHALVLVEMSAAWHSSRQQEHVCIAEVLHVLKAQVGFQCYAMRSFYPFAARNAYGLDVYTTSAKYVYRSQTFDFLEAIGKKFVYLCHNFMFFLSDYSIYIITFAKVTIIIEMTKQMAEQHLKFAIFGNEYQAKKSVSIETILAFLEKKKAEIYVENAYYDFLVRDLQLDVKVAGVFEDYNFDVDYVISMGGDGTFLKAASKVGAKGTPIIGINMGRLGFLADVLPSEIETALDSLYAGECQIEEHAVIQVEARGGVLAGNPFALNDIAVLKRDDASMISIRTHVDGEFLVTYQADGLIVTTPTGSTAYNLSNGGPIIIPQSGSLCLTPVAPHSLNIRPIVINDTAEIQLDIESRSHNYLVAIDGRSERMTEETSLVIRKAAHSIKIVKQRNQRYFSTLREKLMWGADQRER